jgi:hypothetical protein
MKDVTPDGRPLDAGGDGGPEDLPVTVSPVRAPAAHDVPAPDESPVVPVTEGALPGRWRWTWAWLPLRAVSALRPPCTLALWTSSPREWGRTRSGASGGQCEPRVGQGPVVELAAAPGQVRTAWRWGEGLEIALIFALLNAFVKPVLQFASLRFCQLVRDRYRAYQHGPALVPQLDHGRLGPGQQLACPDGPRWRSPTSSSHRRV